MSAIKDYLSTGDKVMVQVSSDYSLVGTLLGMPQATGDAWRIRQDNGQLVYVQTYQTIHRIESKEPTP